MKRNLIVFLGLILTQLLSAQFSYNTYLFFKIGPSFGNYSGSEISLEYIVDKRLSFGAGVYRLERLADNIPDDYIPPFGGLSFFNLFHPKKNATTYFFSIGKILELEKHKRLNLSGGIGYLNLKEPINYVKIIPQESTPEVYHSAENYTYDYSSVNNIALVLNPEIDFTRKYIGLSLGVISIVSRDYFSCGVKVSLLLGFVNQ